jgi:hypothetical protein
MSMKNSSKTIGNRNRDLPGCSAVPQPTAPPRAADLVLNPTEALILKLSQSRSVDKEVPFYDP